RRGPYATGAAARRHGRLDRLRRPDLRVTADRLRHTGADRLSPATHKREDRITTPVARERCECLRELEDRGPSSRALLVHALCNDLAQTDGCHRRFPMQAGRDTCEDERAELR